MQTTAAQDLNRILSTMDCYVALWRALQVSAKQALDEARQLGALADYMSKEKHHA